MKSRFKRFNSLVLILFLSASILLHTNSVSAAVTHSSYDWEGVTWDTYFHSGVQPTTLSSFQSRDNVLKIQNYAHYANQLNYHYDADNTLSQMEISVDFYPDYLASWSWGPALRVTWDNGVYAWIRGQSSTYGEWAMTGKSKVQQYGAIPFDRWYNFKIVARQVPPIDGDNTLLSIYRRDITNNGPEQLMMSNYVSDALFQDFTITLGSLPNTDYSSSGSMETFYYDNLRVNGQEISSPPDFSLTSVNTAVNGYEGSYGARIDVEVENTGGTGTFELQLRVKYISQSGLTDWQKWIHTTYSWTLSGTSSGTFYCWLPSTFVALSDSDFAASSSETAAMTDGDYMVTGVSLRWYYEGWQYNRNTNINEDFTINQPSDDVIMVALAVQDGYLSSLGYQGTVYQYMEDATAHQSFIQSDSEYFYNSAKEYFDYGFEEMMNVDFRYYVLDHWSPPTSEDAGVIASDLIDFASTNLGLPGDFDGTLDDYTVPNNNRGFDLVIGLKKDGSGTYRGAYFPSSGVIWAGTTPSDPRLELAQAIIVHEIGHRFGALFGDDDANWDTGLSYYYDHVHHRYDGFMMYPSNYFLNNNPYFPDYFPWLRITYNSMANPFPHHEYFEDGNFEGGLGKWTTSSTDPSATTTDSWHVYRGYKGLRLYHYDSGTRYFYPSYIEQAIDYAATGITDISFYMRNYVVVYLRIDLSNGNYVSQSFGTNYDWRKVTFTVPQYTGVNVINIKFYTTSSSTCGTALDEISINFSWDT